VGTAFVLVAVGFALRSSRYRWARVILNGMGQPKPTGDDDVPNELRSLVDQLATLSAADRERIVRHLRDARGIAQLGGDAVKDTEALYDG
jgi:hypothetical protein